MVKRASWPNVKFVDSGKNLSVEVLAALEPLRNVDYLEFLQKWNGGTPAENCFKVTDASGSPTVAEVTQFFGITDHFDPSDVRNAVFRYWDYLPRMSLPIAQVAIGDESNLCLLLTFRWGPLHNQIFLLNHPHECGPENPDDLNALRKVASSLPMFLKSLGPREQFHYRAWYKLPIPPDQLASVADRLLESGLVDPYRHFKLIRKRQSGFAVHPKLRFGLWLAHAGKEIRKIGAPKPVPDHQTILAVDAYQWDHAAAEKHLKKTLASLKIKPLTKLGETKISETTEPYNPADD